MLPNAIMKFINRYDYLIDAEDWKSLLEHAGDELSPFDQEHLVDVLEQNLPNADLSEIQWQLLYQDLFRIIPEIEKVVGRVYMWKILGSLIRYGLNVFDVKYGLLDDPDLEWVDVTISDTVKDHLLMKWRNKYK